MPVATAPGSLDVIAAARRLWLDFAVLQTRLLDTARGQALARTYVEHLRAR